MANLDEMLLAALRKHVATRRQDIADRFPKHLAVDEYHRHCGRHEELERFAVALQEAVRAANAHVGEGDDDDDPTD